MFPLSHGPGENRRLEAYHAAILVTPSPDRFGSRLFLVAVGMLGAVMLSPTRILFPVARVAHVAASLILSFTFLYVYETYISVRWAYMGFPFRQPILWQTAFTCITVSIVSFVMPTKVDRPYTLILWFLYAFVFVPTMTITFLVTPRPQMMVLPLICLAVTFIACSLASKGSRIASQAPTAPYKEYLPGQMFRFCSLVAWFVVSAALLFHFSSILRFSGLDDIYYQRAISKEEGGGIFEYLQTYYSAVICPLLISIGFMRGKQLYLVLGLLGCLLTYMIGAQKTALLIPIGMIGIYLSFRYKVASTLNYTTILAGIVVVCAGLAKIFPSGNFLVDLVTMRALAAPAQTYSQYYELFSTAGYTWWSNVRGISLFVPAPAMFASDPNWPSLGYIVGDYMHAYTTAMNANASPFSGEGIAAAGPAGVLVIGLILIAWLRVADAITVGWNGRFVLLIMTPIAFTLTNGHLSTTLLSFGGLFWTIVLHVSKPVSLEARRGSVALGPLRWGRLRA